MTILNDPLFLALFNTPVPRVIIKADALNYTIIAANDAYTALTSTENKQLKDKILKKVFDIENQDSGDIEITPVADPNGNPEFLLISVNKNAQLSVATANEQLSAAATGSSNAHQPAEKQISATQLTTREQRNRLPAIIKHVPIGLCILAGKNMVLEMVNEGMLKIWNRDQSIAGKPLLEFMPELKEQEFPRLLDEVYSTGVTYKTMDALVLLMTRQGLQKVYMDFSYTALKNEDGNIDSILVLAEDVTERSLSRMREQQLTEELTVMNEELSASHEALQKVHEDLIKSEFRFRKLVQQAPVAIGVLNGPEHLIESANDKMLAFLGKSEVIIGLPVATALPEHQGQYFLEHLNEVYTSGKLFFAEENRARFNHAGNIKDGFFTYIFEPVKDARGVTTGVIVVAIDVTVQVLARKKAENSEKRFRFLLDAIPQQVWTASPNGILEYVNQIMCNDFGKESSHLVMNGWHQYIHPDDFRRCMQKYLKAIKTGQEYMDEFRLLLSDGKYHWHLGRVVPLIEREKVQLWIGTNTNIDFQKANEFKKDEFLSIASHELKTPLTSIKAFNQLLSRTTEEERIRAFTQKSFENILRLERLINDLLDVTKINAGKMVYTNKPFNFRQMLEESIENVQHTTTHQIILESAPDLEYDGDLFRLEQVMHNFLTNAIKYSPEAGNVIVNAKVEKENVVVSIQDFGIGIAEKDLNRLFERYYRADNTAMRFEGLGLGLFIASEVLKRHQGSFWIESQEGQGSTFFFRLPLQTAKAQENLTITFNESSQYLYVDWTGFQNIESVQSGCMSILKSLRKHQVTKIVNDNTNVLGSWSEAAEWVGELWLPMAKEAGLRYLAWIYSPTAFNKLSANKTFDVSDRNITIRFFTDLSLGIKWINEQS